MKTQIFLFIILSFFLSACQQNTAQQEEISKLKTQLEAARSQIAAAQKEQKTKKPLRHLVYFKLKENTSPKDKLIFTNLLKGLTVIHEIKDFEVGQFKDLGDKRAMSDLDVMMKMAFENEADYRTYQKHPIHLETKEKVKKFLAGAPVTYDYELE